MRKRSMNIAKSAKLFSFYCDLNKGLTCGFHLLGSNRAAYSRFTASGKTNRFILKNSKYFKKNMPEYDFLSSEIVCGLSREELDKEYRGIVRRELERCIFSSERYCDSVIFGNGYTEKETELLNALEEYYHGVAIGADIQNYGEYSRAVLVCREICAVPRSEWQKFFDDYFNGRLAPGADVTAYFTAPQILMQSADQFPLLRVRENKLILAETGIAAVMPYIVAQFELDFDFDAKPNKYFVFYAFYRESQKLLHAE